MKAQNPFVYNSPVLTEDFFDREVIIDRVFHETVLGKTQGDVWIVGERKVGKTSLLQYFYMNWTKFIPEEIKVYGCRRKFKPVFAFANVQYCSTNEEFYNELWQSLKNVLDFKMTKARKAEENFIRALEYTYKNRFYPVFLIDEFDAFLEMMAIEHPRMVRTFVNRFNSYLKNFPDIQRKIFSCIFASNQDFIELNNKYDLKITGSGIIAESFEIEWFTREQVMDLTKQYLKGKRLKFTAKEINTLYKYTEGYPYFTQKVLYQMFKLKSKKKQDLGKNDIREIAQKELTDTIKYWIGQNMPSRTSEKLKNLLNNIGEKAFDLALNLLEQYLKSQILK